MKGVVNGSLEATLEIEVRGPTGNLLKIKAVIDTGNNGALSLPFAAVQSLALTPAGSGIVTFGDGQRRVRRFYYASMLWDGQVRPVQLLCEEGDVLIGTGLLKGYRLEADFQVGGDVTLTPLP
jgi:clan AA aspartic protease